MEVSPNALRKETIATLKEVNLALELTSNLGPEVTASLLLAKTQCLNTLVLLNEKR
jgi:hypothetical protein